MEDTSSHGSVVSAPSTDWVERLVYRDLYGVFKTLTTRPLSRGHDGAIKEATDIVLALASQLERSPTSMLDDIQWSILRLFLNQMGKLPPEVIARTLIGPIEALLADRDGALIDLPRCYVAKPRIEALERLVVSIGPTIGLGDEVLVARALVERARQTPAFRIDVASRHFDIWQCLDATLSFVEVPLGAYQLIESLGDQERRATAYLYIDFLSSDPTHTPYSGPEGIAYAGRWWMGSTEGEFVDYDNNIAYSFRYPDGLPACRLMECRWFAGQVLPARDSNHSEFPGSWHAKARRASPRVVVQTLTAKPPLMYPPDFYVSLLGRVLKEFPDTQLHFVPSPTAAGQEIISTIIDGLRQFCIGPSSLLERQAINSIHNDICLADLVFGPDTFTSHLAALAGVPQVTISMREHRAWRSVGSPALFVVADDSFAHIQDACARRIGAYLRLHQQPDATLAAAARQWRTRVRRLERLITLYLQDSETPEQAEFTPLVAGLQEIYSSVADSILGLLGDAATPELHLGQLFPFSADRFFNADDLIRALARWYHGLALSDVAGVLEAA